MSDPDAKPNLFRQFTTPTASVGSSVIGGIRSTAGVIIPKSSNDSSVNESEHVGKVNQRVEVHYPPSDTERSQQSLQQQPPRSADHYNNHPNQQPKERFHDQTKSHATQGRYHHSSPPPVAKLGLSKTVYVGNLSWDVEWQDLKDHMRNAGAVVHADVLKEPSGRSKGCGIVEYATVQDANNAILRLHDTNLKGRLIFVREDREANTSNRAIRPDFHMYPHSHIHQQQQHSGPHHPAAVPHQHPAAVKSHLLHQHQPLHGGHPQQQHQSLHNGHSQQHHHQHQPLHGGHLQQHHQPLHGGHPQQHQQLHGGHPQQQHQPLHGQQHHIMHSHAPPSHPHFHHHIHMNSNRIHSTTTTHPTTGASNNIYTKRLYVGNLDYHTTWYELKDHFKTVGNVSRADVARGFGIVEYYTVEEASYAVSQLNDSILNGRKIFVREDRENERRIY